MNKALLFAVCLFGAFTVWFYFRNPLTATVQIRGITYAVDVAVTDKEKEKGLGGRDSLAVNQGMLFPYDHKEQLSFWMMGMKFPIDIIWILDNQIVDITKNVPVGSGGNYPTYKPREPINKVLEVNAGESDKHGFAIGDLVHISD